MAAAITCPQCGTVNEVLITNDYVRPGVLLTIGPVYHCMNEECGLQWTDDTAEDLIEMEMK
jgi:uncharacterized Zn finger protein